MNLKKGRKLNKKGHVLVMDKNHPNAEMCGYVLEHRKIMADHIGRPLNKDEVVHHKNGVKTDNRIENLELMTRGQHSILHNTGSKHSRETRLKISERAKVRLRDPSNHPMYKEVSIQEMLLMRESGRTVKEICSHFGICKRTYYNKLGR